MKNPYKFKMGKTKLRWKTKGKVPNVRVKIFWPTTANLFDYTMKAFDTNEADKYIGHCGRELPKPKRTISTSLPVLQHLYGMPWNNLALSAVTALRPSYLRVTSGMVTTDHRLWRVTVYLGEDGRRIRDIRQEVSLASIGCRTGHDFNYKIAGKPLPKKSSKKIIWSNS